MFDSRDFFPPEEISLPKDTETPVESPIPVSPSSSVGSSSPVRSTTSPPDYPLISYLSGRGMKPLGSEPVPEESNKFNETFGEAWERFKEMLRAYPHHGFSELTQIDTFYNGLNDNDQDSLNAAAGGNCWKHKKCRSLPSCNSLSS
ncbi:hypothetical protein Tco_0869589 [Tanacetum coccineum]